MGGVLAFEARRRVSQDEEAIPPVIPPQKPSSVPGALQQSMPLADVMDVIAKPPGSAPPFIPYKPAPPMVPLPEKHTLRVKFPDVLRVRSAFGDVVEDNLQVAPLEYTHYVCDECPLLRCAPPCRVLYPVFSALAVFCSAIWPRRPWPFN
jgi:hypothetical protein